MRETSNRRVIAPGDLVVVKCADGTERKKIATSSVVDGHDFPIVWVAEVDEWHNALPWPEEDVRLEAKCPEWLR